MKSRNLAAAAVVVLVVIVVGVFALVPSGTKGASSFSLSSSGSSSASTVASTSSSAGSSSQSTVGYQQYDFLVFTQKGIAELASPDGSLLGYARLFNISDSVPAQTFYWEGYPAMGAPQGNFVLPINNGTLEVVNGTSMKVTARMSVGSATGFIGVAVSPDERLAAVADGPSGTVEVINLASLQVVWKQVYDQPSGTTAFPCDIRWAPDQQTIVIPMKNNGTVDVVSAGTGSVVSFASLPLSSQPFMLSVNSQGTMLAVELAGNKTDVFFSYPTLTELATTSFSIPTFSPTRGLFTPDGSYYLEVSSSTNVIEVVSTQTFKVVNTVNLPASSSPGLADIEPTPDGADAYVVMHGTPATGGIIYLVSLSGVATETGPVGSVALTTAPAFAVPVSLAYGTYLADNVLSPPTTGLHC